MTSRLQHFQGGKAISKLQGEVVGCHASCREMVQSAVKKSGTEGAGVCVVYPNGIVNRKISALGGGRFSVKKPEN